MSQQNARHRRSNGKSSGKGGAGSGFGRWLAGLKPRQRLGLLGAALAVVLAVVLTFALAGGTPKPSSSSSTTTTTSGSGTSSTQTTTTRPAHVTSAKICPLTGREALGGKVPQRPALAVKIGNDPGSRPQSGLEHADIVYEEQAEGGITRYMAVFQCQDAPLIGPIRSVRWDDWHILEQYGHAILAYSGGIDPWMQAAASLPWIYNANGSSYPTANAFYRYNSSTLPASQGPPYNYYSSTTALWKLFPDSKTPPPTMFQFSTQVPKGATHIVSASVPFSGASPVVWQWSQPDRQWLRFYNTQPDVDPAGQQFHATNVVIQMVTTQKGPYDESGPDSQDVESITTGTGTAYVLRHGVMLKGTWSRPGGLNITRFTLPDGKPITLEPGTTWVEVVPDTVAVSFTK